MKELVVEPRDTLLFRDAKEFGSEAGSATSLPFPLPSVMAGAIRTRHGYEKKFDFKNKEHIEGLLALDVSSPFLVELSDEGTIAQWYLPAPADAVVFEGLKIQPLIPHQLPEDCLSDFDSEELLALSFRKPRPEKPDSKAPAFWPFSGLFDQWLCQASETSANSGIAGPIRESRIHIQVGNQGTAEDHRLFSTEMLRFSVPSPEGSLATCRRLGLAALITGDDVDINGLFPLGGERRLGHWATRKASFPKCPDAVRKAIHKCKKARIILITPGYFAAGDWRPKSYGEGVTLRAVALRGFTTASGWDLRAGKPKPSRRLAPAGTVYFVQLPTTWDDKQIDTWLDTHWCTSLSDDPQSSRDGFGMTVVGAWPEEIPTLEKGKF